MKGTHQRYLQRTAQKTFDRSMAVYEQVLDQVVKASGDGKAYRQDQQELNRTIRVGEIYAIRCTDDDRYYVTFQVAEHPLTSKYIARFSNVVPGDPPPGMPITTEAQASKRIRELNAGTTISNQLMAFPFRGVQGGAQGGNQDLLVTDLHRSLQKRGGQ